MPTLPSEHRTRILSAAFLGVRQDRDSDYYLRPLRDFADHIRLTFPDLRLTVFTQPENVDQLRRYVPAEIVGVDLDDAVSVVWPEREWRTLYHQMISRNPTHCESYQAQYPDLIGVYLAKIGILHHVCKTSRGPVLWMDAGHWISHQCDHQLSRYTDEAVKAFNAEAFAIWLDSLAQKYGVVGIRVSKSKQRFHMPLPWMYEYTGSPDLGLDDQLPLYQGVFLLVRPDMATSLVLGFKHWWGVLIRDKKAGTEENALTLYGWEKGFWSCSYAEWQHAMTGGNVDPIRGQACLHMSD